MNELEKVKSKNNKFIWRTNKLLDGGRETATFNLSQNCSFSGQLKHG
jgi:hypothetical protein